MDEEETEQPNEEKEEMEDMESDLAYDYRDKEYYSLPRKEQKMMDMVYYGYIDENDEPNDETIMEDSAYLGKQIGTWLGNIAIKHNVPEPQEI